MSRAEEWDAALVAVLDWRDRVDVLINNAGVLGARPTLITDRDEANLRTVIEVNMIGTFLGMGTGAPVMASAGGGSIVNVSSILGLTAFPGWALYCAGKYALEGLSESLAAEVAEFGIKVSLVEPGYTRTDFLRPVSLGLPAATADGYGAIREMTDAHLAMPGTQLGDPIWVAAAIIAVALDRQAPLHQVLGSDSYALAKARLEALENDIEAGRELALTTDVSA